jgi:guanylate kinase
VRWNRLITEIKEGKRKVVDDNILVLLVGKSGAGKTTLENRLVKNFGFRGTKSYTTRPRRFEGEDSHIFISEEEFNALENKVAYTEFNGYKYCATKEQLDNANVYVVDPDGVETLMKNYDRNFFIVFLDVNKQLCEKRMKERGDDSNAIKTRLDSDEKIFETFKAKADVVIDASGGIDRMVGDFLVYYIMMRLESEVVEWERLNRKLP